MNIETSCWNVYNLLLRFSIYCVLVFQVSTTDETNCFLTSEMRKCGTDFCLNSTSTTSITSPNYPLSYPSNADCIWTIKAPFGTRIVITFESFTLQSSPIAWQCTHDYLKIEDVTSTNSYCGSRVPDGGKYLSVAPQIKLHFLSDQAWNYRGFKLKISVSNVVQYRSFTQGPGTILSPAFPKSYPSNTFAVWKLKAPNNQQVSLACNNTFDLQRKVNCASEALYISEKSTMINASKYCMTIPNLINSAESALFLIFKSDANSHHQGFMCYFHFNEKITDKSDREKQQSKAKTCRCGNFRQSRIAGGMTVVGENLPWMAGIVTNLGRVICGGTLIAPQYVLTAAHCLERFKPADIRIVIEKYNPDNLKENYLVTVLELTTHEMYDPSGHDYDIGLVKIEKLSHINEESCVCLPETTVSVLLGKSATLYGWGATETSKAGFVHLQKVTIPFIDWKKCRTLYKDKFKIFVTARMICTSIENGKDACGGDSGGPLVMNMNGRLRIVGLVAFGGSTCGKSFYPGVFSRVASHITWIVKHANLNCEPPT